MVCQHANCCVTCLARAVTLLSQSSSELPESQEVEEEAAHLWESLPIFPSHGLSPYLPTREHV